MSKQIIDEPIQVDLEELNKTSEGSMVANLGIRYTYVGTARVEGTMPVDERTCQPFGYLHGGASLAFAETISGLGTMAIIEKDGRVTNIKLIDDIGDGCGAAVIRTLRAMPRWNSATLNRIPVRYLVRIPITFQM